MGPSFGDGAVDSINVPFGVRVKIPQDAAHSFGFAFQPLHSGVLIRVDVNPRGSTAWFGDTELLIFPIGVAESRASLIDVTPGDTREPLELDSETTVCIVSDNVKIVAVDVGVRKEIREERAQRSLRNDVLATSLKPEDGRIDRAVDTYIYFYLIE